MANSYYMTLCRRCCDQWRDGELLSGMIDNEWTQFRCDGCGHVADALAQVKFEGARPCVDTSGSPSGTA
jgi:hypothetical protein